LPMRLSRRIEMLNFAETAATFDVFTCRLTQVTNSPIFAVMWAEPATKSAIGKDIAFLAMPFR
jgi:hypothetical protein